jgi:hypothetical protein
LPITLSPGDHVGARGYLERAFPDYVVPTRRSTIIRFQLAPGGAFLARVLWLQGFPDQAMQTAEISIADVRVINHPLLLCQALTIGVCPLALLTGDLAAAERSIDMLLDHSARHALASWHAFGRGFQGALAIRRGDVSAGLRLLRATFDAAPAWWP